MGSSPTCSFCITPAWNSAEAALDWLTRQESGVSCHYLVDEDGRIAQLVAESDRAWHAGQSRWAGETDINSCSIGIEIHNPGHDFDYPDFPDAEMRAVEALCLDILSRHCNSARIACSPIPMWRPAESATPARNSIGSGSRAPASAYGFAPVPIGGRSRLGPWRRRRDGCRAATRPARLWLWR